MAEQSSLLPRARRRWLRSLAPALLTAATASAESAAPAATSAPPEPGLHLLGALSVGRGLRFNNPYRLATPLGDSAESVSLSATYLDLGAGILFPAAAQLEHGVAVDAVLALDGIAQFVLTPAYLLNFDATRRWALRGRLGIPIVVAPDSSLGLEAGFGPRFELGYGLGLTAELVGSVFFGAATEQKSVTTIPILALQLGISFDRHVAW
ncbi:MAG TPA: hypothetical protein VJU61_14250 [Polyangiaceae bacterium]|nr:hypothetical protein [Polyangiaceae bacterium]